ncbi:MULTISPECIES: AAA family ATPase [Bacillota]|uniref:AAA family ATPase n=1 Tax=Bacillota TaxID=1239 RepID=UPI0039EE9CA1
MAEKIFFAIPSYDNYYSEIARELEPEFLVYKNASTQEELLALLVQNTPEYLVFENQLNGTRNNKDFLNLLVNQYPTITFISWKDNPEEIIKMLKGEMEPPELEIGQEEDLESEIEEIEDIKVIEESNNSYSELEEEIKREEERKAKKQEVWKKITNAKIKTDTFLNRTIALTGFNGGNGKTEVAINFSAWLSNNGYKVALLGFNLQNDDLGERLGIERERRKGLVAAHELYVVKEMSIKSLQDVMCQYSEGFDVLIGNEYPEDSEQMTEGFFVEIIELLKLEYDFVIIDTESNNYSIAWLPVLNTVDNILIPCTSHISDLYHLQRGITNLKDRYNIPISKCDVIHNKAGEGGHIDDYIIMKNTGLECIAILPYSKDVLRGAENEKPAVLKPSAYKVKKAMDQLMFRYAGKKNKRKDFVKPAILHYKKEVMRGAKRINPFSESN